MANINYDIRQLYMIKNPRDLPKIGLKICFKVKHNYSKNTFKFFKNT